VTLGDRGNPILFSCCLENLWLFRKWVAPVSIKQDRVVGVFLLGFALWYALVTRSFNVPFQADPIGPKAFPVMLAITMAVVSVFLIIKPEPGQDRAHTFSTWLRLLATFGCFILYAVTLLYLGFITATTLSITLLTQVFRGPLLKAFIASLLFSVALYGLFDMTLEVSLPTGRLWGGR